jgi:hypothetical protein
VLEARERRGELYRVVRAMQEATCRVEHMSDDPGVARHLGPCTEGYRVRGLPDERQVAALTDDLHAQAITATSERPERIRQGVAPLDFGAPLITCALPHVTSLGDTLIGP